MPPPVVLVHGLGSSFDHGWREPGWVDILADAGRDTIAVDLLGHGTAPAPHDPAAYTDLTARVLDALPEANAGPVDAIGFSLGGRTLLELAANHPGRIRRLVAGGVGNNLLDPADYEPVAGALSTSDTSAEGVLGLFVRLAASSGADPLALAALLRRGEGPLTPELLGRVDCPVLVVIGDRDFAGPADPLVAALPDARVKVLRNVDHFATPKDFGFIDAALGFLD